MYDQAGLIQNGEMGVRTSQTRAASQVLERAVAIATSEPKGPVYLSLPREALAESASSPMRPLPTHVRAAAPGGPDLDAIAAAAGLLAGAERRVIVTANAGRNPGAFTVLAQLADAFAAIPVVQIGRATCRFPRLIR